MGPFKANLKTLFDTGSVVYEVVGPGIDPIVIAHGHDRFVELLNRVWEEAQAQALRDHLIEIRSAA